MFRTSPLLAGALLVGALALPTTASAAARDRQVLDKLKQRQHADHNREWARRAQGALDEVALSVHRRGVAA